MPNIGALIRDARMSKGWSQSHLAKAAGLSTRTVIRAEGGAGVAGESLMALGAALEIDLFRQEKVQDAPKASVEGRSLLVILPDVVTPTWLRRIMSPFTHVVYGPLKLIGVFGIVCLVLMNPWFFDRFLDRASGDVWVSAWTLVLFLFGSLFGIWIIAEMLDDSLAYKDPTFPIRISLRSRQDSKLSILPGEG